jgi:hypothetical protein
MAIANARSPQSDGARKSVSARRGRRSASARRRSAGARKSENAAS